MQAMLKACLHRCIDAEVGHDAADHHIFFALFRQIFQHDDGPGTGFSIGDDEFDIYSEFAPLQTEKRFVKTVCNAFKKESGLLEYLTAKGEKDVMVCGIMTDFCINATIEAGFEHDFHMIVPAYANSTQDNEYMTGEQSYHYYNEFLWPDCYAGKAMLWTSLVFANSSELRWIQWLIGCKATPTTI